MNEKLELKAQLAVLTEELMELNASLRALLKRWDEALSEKSLEVK